MRNSYIFAFHWPRITCKDNRLLKVILNLKFMIELELSQVGAFVDGIYVDQIKTL